MRCAAGHRYYRCLRGRGLVCLIRVSVGSGWTMKLIEKLLRNSGAVVLGYMWLCSPFLIESGRGVELIVTLGWFVVVVPRLT